MENTWENRLKVARVIRQTRPRVVILPYWEGRHPDHYTASKLGYEACFLAGLAKLDVERALSNQQSASGQVASAGANAGGRRKQSASSAAKADRAGRRGGTTKSRALPDPKDPEQSASNAGEAPAPHRPFKIIYATLYHDVRPTFVVDISEQFEARFESLMAYKSQFSDQEAGKRYFSCPRSKSERVSKLWRGSTGCWPGVTYAEPFLQKEVGLVEDVDGDSGEVDLSQLAPRDIMVLHHCRR